MQNSGLVLAVAFLKASAKRYTVFKAAVKHLFPNRVSECIRSLCDTRWVERHEAIETFIELMPAIKLCLQQVRLYFHFDRHMLFRYYYMQP